MVPRQSICGVLILCFAGCSGGDTADRKPTHTVSGTVTMAGGPVADASVIYSPLEGQPVAMGRTDSTGKYTLTTYDSGDGAVAGKYVALVTKSSGGGASTPAQSSHEAFVSGQYNPAVHGRGGSGKSGSGSALPERYSDATKSDLAVVVEAGKDNVHELKLNP